MCFTSGQTQGRRPHHGGGTAVNVGLPSLCRGIYAADSRKRSAGPTAKPAPAQANWPYWRWCRDRRERYNGFRRLFAAGHRGDWRFDGREKRSTGNSDLPARIVA